MLEEKIKDVKERAVGEAKAALVYTGIGAGLGAAWWAAKWFFPPLALVPFGPKYGAFFGGTAYIGTRTYSFVQKVQKEQNYLNQLKDKIKDLFTPEREEKRKERELRKKLISEKEKEEEYDKFIQKWKKGNSA